MDQAARGARPFAAGLLRESAALGRDQRARAERAAGSGGAASANRRQQPTGKENDENDDYFASVSYDAFIHCPLNFS